ncbi:ABC transporter substrate-binding protein [Eubacteriales bacterium OttesenSCG-928-G02]|nr:ABC transporter substrate-binding protein [Eubacteriales bacterium OttesenSCG-928-G02]
MKKSISLLMVLLLITIVLISCNSNETSDDKNGSDASAYSDDASGNVSEEPVDPKDGLTEKISEYSGRTLTIFTAGAGTTYHSELIPMEENPLHNETAVMPDRINEAIASRNKRIAEEYNITIKEIYQPDSDRPGGGGLKAIRNAFSQGDDSFQAINAGLYDMGTLLLEGSLYDLNRLENIKLNNPWWDQSVNDNVTINYKQYFAVGDIGIGNKNATTAIFFNKSLMEKMNLDNPYTLVKNKEWTLDKALELCKKSQFTEDINNDGKIDYTDNFCWGGQNDNIYAWFYGTGNRVLSPDSNGYPTLTFYTERAAETIDKTLAIMNDDDIFVSGNDYFNVSSTPMTLIQDAFINGRAIFYTNTISNAMELSDMKDEFGILPVPLYDKDQDEYYSLINTWISGAYGIAKNVSEEDAEFAAAVLDYLGYYSWKGLGTGYLATEYYEVVLKYQGLEGKEEALETLDMIFGARGCELGSILRIGNSGGLTANKILTNLITANGSGQFSSKYQEAESVLKADLDNALSFFKNKQ